MTGFARRGIGGLPDAGGVRAVGQAGSWALLLFSGGTILSAALQRHLFEQRPTAQHWVEFNVGEAFALAALVSQIRAVPDGGMTLTRSDRTILVLAALAWFVPEAHGVYAATTLAGAWALLRRRADRRWIGLGQIWLALSIYELWGKLLFKLVYQTIEGFEVGLITGVGRLIYADLGTTGASLSIRSDWSIVVLEGCSSFHNLSLAILIWLSILKIADRPADRAARGGLATSFCLVVTINVARILAMLPSREAYHHWHDGSGSSLVALASVAAMIGPTLFWIEERACVDGRRS